MLTQVRLCKCIRTFIHICIYIYIRIYICTCICICIDTYVYQETHTSVHININICICIIQLFTCMAHRQKYGEYFHSTSPLIWGAVPKFGTSRSCLAFYLALHYPCSSSATPCMSNSCMYIYIYMYIYICIYIYIHICIYNILSRIVISTLEYQDFFFSVRSCVQIHEPLQRTYTRSLTHAIKHIHISITFSHGHTLLGIHMHANVRAPRTGGELGTEAQI